MQNKIASCMTVCLCFYFYANKLEWISDSQPFDWRGLLSVQTCTYIKYGVMVWREIERESKKMVV